LVGGPYNQAVAPDITRPLHNPVADIGDEYTSFNEQDYDLTSVSRVYRLNYPFIVTVLFLGKKIVGPR